MDKLASSRRDLSLFDGEVFRTLMEAAAGDGLHVPLGAYRVVATLSVNRPDLFAEKDIDQLTALGMGGDEDHLRVACAALVFWMMGGRDDLASTATAGLKEIIRQRGEEVVRPILKEIADRTGKPKLATLFEPSAAPAGANAGSSFGGAKKVALPAAQGAEAQEEAVGDLPATDLGAETSIVEPGAPPAAMPGPVPGVPVIQ